MKKESGSSVDGVGMGSPASNWSKGVWEREEELRSSSDPEIAGRMSMRGTCRGMPRS